MKLITLILTVCVVHISANSYSQSQKISMNVKNYPLEKVFQEIEKQTNFRFLYRMENVENKIADLTADNSTLEQILDKLLNNRDITYKILDNNLIVITPSEKLQANKITGKVIDASTGEPLPGVNVVVSGTTIGVVTDVSGNYTVEVTANNASLIFSYIGYISEEIALGGSSIVDVKLTPDIKKLDEIVVIGYGTTSKRAVTGSIQKLSGDQVITSNTTNIASSLQGKASGVQITQNSGDPNSAINIRIRGTSSINSGGNPLIVVDGIPGGMSLNDLNPSDIESIEILKDASAGAIYGSRAANGVVLVSTKKGNKEKSTLNIEFQRGVSTATKDWDIANAGELLSIYDQANWNRDPVKKANQTPTVFPEYGWDGYSRELAEGTKTNWKDIVQQKGEYNLISMQTSGGGEKTKFLLSGYYRDYTSLNPGSDYQKAQGRFSIEHQAQKWLTLGTNIASTYSQAKDPWANYTDAYTTLLPIYPIYSPSRTNSYFYDRKKSGERGKNPYYLRDESWNDKQAFNTMTLGYVDVKPFKFLSFRSEWSLNFNNSRGRKYESKELRRETDSYAYQMSSSIPKVGVSGGINYGRYQVYNWTTNNYLTFDKEFGNHKVNVVAGQSAESYTSDGNGAQYEGFPSDYFTLTNANTELSATRQSITFDQYRFLSYFGRAKYSFKGKYHAELQYRADGSTRFGQNNRWGYFPGAALSWVFSEENFMKKISVIDYLKIRASRGFVGNAEMGNYPYLSSLLNWVPYGGSPGFLFDRIGNNEIHWESQVQTDLGIDFSILNNRISGNFDYFIKDARDLIVENRIGNFHGYNSQAINVNLGTLRNEGFDFGLTTHNFVGKFSWDTEFNISKSKSVIKKLSPNQKWIDAGRNRVAENYPLGAYYLPIWAGVDPVTGHELVYTVNQGAESTQIATPGDLTGEVADAERMNASQYNNQRVLLKDKTPYPKYYGGFTNTFRYAGLELSVLFVYQYGNWIYDEGIQNLNYPSTNFDRNVSPELLKGWTAENPTNIPLLWNSQMSGRSSSRFLYDGSYLRLKNLTLAYNLPKSVVNKLRISNIRIFVMGENLLTFTNYPGADPEFFRAEGSGANIAPGLAGITMPQVKTISVGVSLGL